MDPPGKKLTIAIDGYSSCGKSTFARTVANDLGYLYIDSGAMYRAVALYCIKHQLIRGYEVDQEMLTGRLDDINISFEYNPDTGIHETLLNDKNVEAEIRGVEVSGIVSQISKIKKVREKMVALQRKMGESKGVVMEGRDIGTVVFPKAEIKIFMVADMEIRARRRYDELITKGIRVNYNEIKQNIEDRDNLDLTREESPLIKAPDAIVLDNSTMTVDDQIEWFDRLLREY